MQADLTLALAIAMAIAFGVTNGFHDAANAIATLVATRAARPLPAVVLASVFNLLGPLFVGAAVANTIATMVSVRSEARRAGHRRRPERGGRLEPSHVAARPAVELEPCPGRRPRRRGAARLRGRPPSTGAPSRPAA